MQGIELVCDSHPLDALHAVQPFDRNAANDAPEVSVVREVSEGRPQGVSLSAHDVQRKAVSKPYWHTPYCA